VPVFYIIMQRVGALFGKGEAVKQPESGKPSAVGQAER